MRENVFPCPAVSSGLSDYFKTILLFIYSFHLTHATTLCHEFHKSQKEVVLPFIVLT